MSRSSEAHIEHMGSGGMDECEIMHAMEEQAFHAAWATIDNAMQGDKRNRDAVAEIIVRMMEEDVEFKQKILGGLSCH